MSKMTTVLVVVQSRAFMITVPAVLLSSWIYKSWPKFRESYFAYFWSRYGKFPSLDEDKQALFEDLRMIKSTDSIRVLELGVGSGGNFMFYPEKVKLVALDINKNFKPYLEKNLENYPGIELEKFILGPAHDLSEIPDETVDAVISTQVLCGVEKQEQTLAEVKRVLVKGGRFYFLEHVPYPEKTMANRIQWMVNPMWKVLFGCSLMNPINSNLSEAGFVSITAHSKNYEKLWYLTRPHIYGHATKSLS